VLEWRLDPTSPHHIDAITDHRQAIIVMCNEGTRRAWSPPNSRTWDSPTPPT